MRDNNLSTLKEMLRIIIPAAVAVFLFVFSSFGLFIPRFEENLLEDRKLMAKELVYSSWHLLQHLDQEVGKGKYVLQDAKSTAIGLLRSMHYGIDQKNYFWVNDFTPTLVMHPYRPDLEGKDLSELTDPRGTKVFIELSKKAREKGEGYVPYMWQWMDDPTRIVPKLSFIKVYQPWGWIIGTGIYLEDVEEEITSMTKRLTVASVNILILVLLLTWYQIHRAIKALKIRQQAVADLAFKNLILSTQQETSLDGIIVVDNNGKIISYNQRFLKMWDIAEEIFESKNKELPLQSIVEKVSDPTKFLETANYLDKNQDQKSLDEITLKDDRVFDRYSSPMFEPDGTYLGRVWSFRDITFQKQAEVEKRTLEHQLRQAQKIEAIGTLAGGIAHDFNNILTPILGYSEMAIEALPPDNPAVADIREVVGAATRAKELIYQILTFSRQAEQEWKPLRIQIVLKEALKLLRSSIPTTIEIQQRIDPECMSVLADPTQVHQIIMNLCTNAYHAMEQRGGILAVSLEQIELDAEELKYKINLPPGPYVRLEVTDNGTGMNRITMEKIFEPYFTTKPKGKGTGLGLSVIHGIMKSCGGEITVYSEPDQGTSFHLYFPVIEGKYLVSERDVAKQIPTGHEKILLVDDEEIIVKMERIMLEKLGYQITSFTDSQEALQAFRTTPDSFDLLITDLTMPQLTGIQLASEVNAIRADLPIILLSGFSETMNAEKAKSLGIREYIMKPVIKKELAQVIRKVLDEKPSQEE